DALLGDWRTELARIEPVLGLPEPSARAARAIDRFLTPGLRHNAGEADFDGYGWAGALTKTVHAWVVSAATRPPAAPDPPAATARARGPCVLAGGAGGLERRRQECGFLVSPAACELDTSRTEALALRQQIEWDEPRTAGLREELARLREDLARQREALEAVE